jgi:hypothetical protein
VKYAFMQEHRFEFTIVMMARVLGVSCSGFYALKRQGVHSTAWAESGEFGEYQASCRVKVEKIHAACCLTTCSAASTVLDGNVTSSTLPIGCQLRVSPLRRSGCLRRAGPGRSDDDAQAGRGHDRRGAGEASRT